jgi:CheY-like chemotaxis protein
MKTILIIEDNADIRENTAELLAIHQYDVLTAENGREGFTIAKNKLPDLILCDIMMPETDGHQFLALAKADSNVQTIPIIFLSASTPAMVMQKRVDKKVSGYLKKPFLEEDLLYSIESFLE